MLTIEQQHRCPLCGNWYVVSGLREDCERRHEIEIREYESQSQ